METQEQEIKRLRRENRTLRAKIAQLESQLGGYYNEELRDVDGNYSVLGGK